MLNIILFDNPRVRGDLLPLTFTRPTSLIRQGILTIREKWEHFISGKYSYLTEDYLSVVFPMLKPEYSDNNLLIAGHISPTQTLAEAVKALRPGKKLVGSNGEMIAARGASSIDLTEKFESIVYESAYPAVRSVIEIFEGNKEAIERDFELLTSGRKSCPISDSNCIIGPRERIFIEEGASMEGATINTLNGPVYLARGAEVMEGACIRGGLSVGENSHVNMGAKIYGPTTLGPQCKVGGELNNVVFIGYSNKGHDGFLGNSVIGQWCNLGGGTTASNLKNDYSEIKLWNYPQHRFIRTGRQFCGLIMGDHSKAGINTMFNTATVVGVGANIHGSGFPRNFVASFTEGSPGAGFTDVNPARFFDIARRVMARRHVVLTEADIRMYTDLYEITEKYR